MEVHDNICMDIAGALDKYPCMAINNDNDNLVKHNYYDMCNQEIWYT